MLIRSDPRCRFLVMLRQIQGGWTDGCLLSLDNKTKSVCYLNAGIDKIIPANIKQTRST